MIDYIKINKRGVVRRSKLYYLRKLTGKAAKIKERIGVDKKILLNLNLCHSSVE